MTKEAETRKILVLGGGIGGLTAAISLRQAGHEVEVLEIRDTWAVEGWGLSLTGPSLRALQALGLTEKCLSLGYGITQMAICDGDGDEFAVVDLPGLLGPGCPSQAGIARPALARLLREEAEARGAILRTSLTASSFTETTAGVTATLSDGTTRDVDLVVAADGVRSRTRALLGITVEPAYTGQMIWRAIVPRPAWATKLNVFNGLSNTAGLIPISEGFAYCFLTENTDDQSVLPQEELPDRMRALLASFGGRVDEVRESIKDPDDVVRRAGHTLLLESPWHVGHVVLIGDAVHTPSPQLVSGAALAIEDALILTEELGRTPNTREAFESYRRRRLDRARVVVDGSIEVSRLEIEGDRKVIQEAQGRIHGALAAPL